jgi:hypothetical protein
VVAQRNVIGRVSRVRAFLTAAGTSSTVGIHCIMFSIYISYERASISSSNEPNDVGKDLRKRYEQLYFEPDTRDQHGPCVSLEHGILIEPSVHAIWYECLRFDISEL